MEKSVGDRQGKNYSTALPLHLKDTIVAREIGQNSPYGTAEAVIQIRKADGIFV